jgi:hypothetical protein
LKLSFAVVWRLTLDWDLVFASMALLRILEIAFRGLLSDCVEPGKFPLLLFYVWGKRVSMMQITMADCAI